MLKKYKPICPAVSSKDFQLLQDDVELDKEDTNVSQQDTKKSAIKSMKKTEKRKLEITNRTVTQRKKSIQDNQNTQSTPGKQAKKLNTKIVSPTTQREVSGEDSSDNDESEDEDDQEEKEAAAVKSNGVSNKKKAAWVDEDDGITLEDAMNSRTFKKARTVRTIDKNENYNEYLKRKFTSRQPRPTWADPKQEEAKSDGEEDEDDLTKQAGGFVQQSTHSRLGASYLKFSRLTDVNKETRGQEGIIVTAVEFHPLLQVALVAGQAGVLSLIQITGGADNPKLAQVRAESFPIRVAHFCAETEVLAGSDKTPDMFIYNMETGESSRSIIRYQDNVKNFRMSPDSKSFAVCGQNGSIRLYSGRTKEFMSEFKMNCYVNDVVYSPNGNTLYSHGGTGDIYEWDVRSPLPVQTFTDDGCLKGTRLALSPDGRLLAAGSSSGVVNLYELPVSVPRPKPIKTLLNLTTGITDLVFHPSGDILGFASLDKSAAVKLYNTRSRAAFLNFPDPRLNEFLARTNSLTFSPRGGYFAFSNNNKSAFLFRLHHYDNY